jgi:type VI secretion system VasD/TssJ family lipoprotein
MKKIALLLMSLILMLTMLSCAKKVIPPPQWTYEKDAVKIEIQADPLLNFDNGKAHTLYLCLYQLSDPNAFNQLSGDRDGLYQLLDCKLFDAGVAASKRLIVNPGDKSTVVMDRAENAKYFAVVAGYYHIEKERITRLVEFPVILEEKGFLSKERIQKPGVLDVVLVLGPEQIEKIERQ